MKPSETPSWLKPYVAGFLFRGCEWSEVALIEKTHPSWQAGKNNAIGGSVLPGEEPVDAMVREFLEETGLQTKPSDWRLFCQLTNPLRGGFVYFFCAHTESFVELKSMTEEHVHWIPVRFLGEISKMSNLNWLIPLARDTNKPTVEAYAPG